MFGWLTERRRSRLRSQEFPHSWLQILKRNVAIFRWLNREDQHELLGHVQVFLDEKHFEGVGGLDLSDEIRVTIAAQACLLLLHRKTEYFPHLVSILVYPTGYSVEEERYVGGGIWEEGPEARVGHTSSQLRALVLAWDAVLSGAQDPSDGWNVVLHEFAHQLDFENRTADGTPALGSHRDYVEWARVMSEELNALRRADQAGVATLLDTYGAQNPTEFFAVATEVFFERPRALRALHPELYAEMSRFIQQDPVTFSAEAGASSFFSP
jgi:Mlc titration factor MtfA (ptsG expression regulator)